MNLQDKNEINEKIRNSFVDDFDSINDAKEKINMYLSEMQIEKTYDYNEFCSLFIEITDKLLDSLTLKEFQNIQITNFISEILSIMVKKKIDESSQDEEKKTFNLLKMEIDKFKINKLK
jgi:hypothetical protein